MNPESMQVRVLAQQAFAVAYRWTNADEGNAEPVLFARFDHPEAGAVDAFAKFYSGSGRGMVNEVTGWLLARACGLPVPAHAFVALVPLAKLPEAPMAESIVHLARKADLAYFPAFCTSNCAATAVQPIIDTPALVDEIRRWPHLHNCVAVDERMANTDRHARNLVRRGMRDFVAIDHGRLAWRANAPDWGHDSLQDPAAMYDNRLADICWSQAPDREKSQHGSATLKRASEWPAPGQHLLDELHHWWGQLVGHDADRAAWAGFVTSRAEHVEYLLRKRFGLLT